MEIKKLISSVITDKPSSRSVNEFIFLCRKLALIQLRRKQQSGRLHSDYFRSSLDDLAIDSIADLFHQDDTGTFIQIQTYFQGISIETLSEKDLLSFLRRLIFARVNQSIFRMYNEIDPVLGKILRNIKLAVQSLHNFTEVDRFGEPCIMPSACDTFEHLPEFDRTDLEQGLRYLIHGNEHVPALLANLSIYLREQQDHSRIVPMMMVAMVFRSLFADQMEETKNSIEDQFVIRDAAVILRDVCSRLMQETEPKYVGKNKVAADVFKTYFDVILENLHATIIQHDGERMSFYTSMKSLMPDITESEYRKCHKSRVEYLARIARKRALKELKRHL